MAISVGCVGFTGVCIFCGRYRGLSFALQELRKGRHHVIIYNDTQGLRLLKNAEALMLGETCLGASVLKSSGVRRPGCMGEQMIQSSTSPEILLERMTEFLSEFPFRGKMLVCDMDGTLLNIKSRVSEKNFNAIDRFVKGGGLFTVATGRMVKAVEPYLDVLPVNIPAIVYNGAAIYDFASKKILWQNCLPENMDKVAARLLEGFPEIGMELFYGGDIYLAGRNAETDEHTKREGFIPIFAEINNIPKPWFKMLIAWKPEKLLEVEDFLSGMKEEFHTMYSEPQFLELLNKTASKGSALKRLAAMLNFPCECIIAMGDNRNDLEMLQTAGTGVAVANAHEEAIKAADLTGGHHDRDAVAQVIDWIEDGTINCCQVV